MLVLVAGSTGLVGSAIVKHFQDRDYEVHGVSTANLNLLNRGDTFEYLHDLRPNAVINAAAVVGGIGANDSFPVDFLSKNLQIQVNIMDAAHSANVERFVFLGSSCIYPRDSEQPIREDMLLTGPLEETNSAYAIAKIAGIELVKSYRKQFNRSWISLMPTNIYGLNDNFDVSTGHVLPALINRFVSAKQEGKNRVVLWGSGRPRREYLHTSDLASAVRFAFEKYDESDHLNIGTGNDISIRDLAELIASEVGYTGQIGWDASKPDGTLRKVLDVSRIRSLGWEPKIDLRQGIQSTIQWFMARVK